MLSGKSKGSYKIDMCSGPIVSRLLLFTGPLALSSVLQLLFNAADIIVVGKYAGDNSLAAVGSVVPLVNLMISTFVGLSVGSNVLASRYYGSRNDEMMTKTVHTSVLISLISGVGLAVIGFVCSKQILTWMSSPEETLSLASLYLRIYSLGMPASMLYNFGSALLRAVGDTRRPMVYLSIAGVVNVLLNLFFVIVLKMDVAGVATATVVSQVISAILVIRCLMSESGALRLVIKKLSIDRYTALRIIGIGFPAGLQGMLFSFSNVIIQSSVNSFGATVVAGNSAAMNIEGFVYMSMNSFYQATISFVSANVGARTFERINKIVIRAQVCVFLTGLILGGTAYMFGHELLSIYTNSEAVVDVGIIRMMYICQPYFLCGMMDVMVGCLRGIGYAILPMIVSLIGACGLRLIWIFTFFRTPRFHEIKYLYLTYPASWAVTFLAHIICYLIVRKRFDRQHGITRN
ncbi:MAG: MATE family efflux transporter [Lachnospiraceae bacterium]|nr:MATE family efflux transporter [Lachnospiraceae bacterium]